MANTITVQVAVQPQNPQAIPNIQQGFNNVSTAAQGATSSIQGTTNAVTSNGGAMALLDTVTGGYASTARDAIEATGLLGSGFSLSSIQATLFGTAARSALTATGIGALIVALVLLAENWDAVTDALGFTNNALEENIRLSNRAVTIRDLQVIQAEEQLKRARIQNAERKEAGTLRQLDLANEAILVKNLADAEEVAAEAKIQQMNDEFQLLEEGSQEALTLAAEILAAEEVLRTLELENKIAVETAFTLAQTTNDEIIIESSRLKEEAITLNAQEQSDLRLEIRSQEISDEEDLLNKSAENHKKASETIIAIEENEANFRSELFKIRLDQAVGVARILRLVAGDNEALQAAAIIIDGAVAVARIVVATQAANAVIIAQGLALAIPTAGASTVTSAALVTANNISAGISIGAIALATGLALSKIGKGGSGTVPTTVTSNATTVSGGTIGVEGRLGDTSPPIIEGSPNNDLGDTIAGALGKTTIRAFVVASDVTNQQELDRQTLNEATL